MPETEAQPRRALMLLFIPVALLLFVAYGFQALPGKRPAYDSLADLLAEQNAKGYVQIGILGSSWPAQQVETIEGTGQVDFIRKNGTPHSYTKFDGYRLKAMRLAAAGGNEVIVVFRSKAKFGSEAVSVPTRPREDEWEREARLIREEQARERLD